ncbi:MAG: helix-hairpin-helix domain-containing protein [Oceanospirillaceae bacterium]|nr:helix-hairpin-helix domain-containing protein [Oceanospirillaceae bacterium]
MTSFTHSIEQNQQPYARFNGDLYYRIEGDQAVLGANVDIINPQVYGFQNCLLQLWACQSPFNGDILDGIKIAERPVYQDAQGCGDETNATLALPPAGQDDYVMVMTLVGVDEHGSTQLLDYANFDNRQLFLQPLMQGAVQFELAADHIDLSVERISNPRDEGTVSGSLSLEIWALAQPYTGGAFAGTRLAATELGTLAGGFELLNNSFRLDLETQPMDGSNLVLMLREWTSAGYLTRDYRALPAQEAVVECPNELFAQNDVVAAPAEVAFEQNDFVAAPVEVAFEQNDFVAEPVEAATEEADAVAEAVEAAAEEAEAVAEAVEVAAEETEVVAEAIEVAAEEAETVVEAVEAVAEEVEAVAESVEAVTEETEAVAEPVEVAAEEAEAVAEVVEAVAEEAEAIAQPVEVAASEDESELVSLNEATAKELIKVKGISPKLATSIIAGRPYDSVDELINVRGIGQRSLERIRPFLSL